MAAELTYIGSVRMKSLRGEICSMRGEGWTLKLDPELGAPSI